MLQSTFLEYVSFFGVRTVCITVCFNLLKWYFQKYLYCNQPCFLPTVYKYFHALHAFNKSHTVFHCITVMNIRVKCSKLNRQGFAFWEKLWGKLKIRPCYSTWLFWKHVSFVCVLLLITARRQSETRKVAFFVVKNILILQCFFWTHCFNHVTSDTRFVGNQRGACKSGVTSPAHAHMQYSDDKMTSYRIGLTTTKGIVYRWLSWKPERWFMFLPATDAPWILHQLHRWAAWSATTDPHPLASCMTLASDGMEKRWFSYISKVWDTAGSRTSTL